MRPRSAPPSASFPPSLEKLAESSSATSTNDGPTDGGELSGAWDGGKVVIRAGVVGAGVGVELIGATLWPRVGADMLGVPAGTKAVGSEVVGSDVVAAVGVGLGADVLGVPAGTKAVGWAVGWPVGEAVGFAVGLEVGTLVVLAVGFAVGFIV